MISAGHIGAGLVLWTLFTPRQISAQQTNPPADLQWSDARDLTLEGKGWSDTRNFYDRWPGRAEKIVRPPVWSLGCDSAGICARFITEATAISVRWTLRREQLALPHMPASG